MKQFSVILKEKKRNGKDIEMRGNKNAKYVSFTYCTTHNFLIFNKLITQLNKCEYNVYNFNVFSFNVTRLKTAHARTFSVVH